MCICKLSLYSRTRCNAWRRLIPLVGDGTCAPAPAAKKSRPRAMQKRVRPTGEMPPAAALTVRDNTGERMGQTNDECQSEVGKNLVSANVTFLLKRYHFRLSD